MKNAVLVFLGGGLGSVLRYLFSALLKESVLRFPIATFTVNAVGALLLGLLSGYATQRPEFFRSSAYLLLATGFCGGFTTFSAFVIEQIGFLEKRQLPYFFGYVLLSISIGLLAGYWGYKGLRTWR